MSLWVPHTPRIPSPCGSPRFVQTIQPRNLDDSLGSCLCNAELEEGGFAVGRAFDDMDESVPHTPGVTSPSGSPRFMQTVQPRKLDVSSFEELALNRTSDDLENHKTLRKAIQEVLLMWLNEEVRDRLDSIDRRLEELRETRVPDRAGIIRQSLATAISGTRYDTCSPSTLEQGSVRFSESVDAIARTADTKTFIPKLNRISTMTTAIERHQSIRGRYAAAVWCFLEDRFSSVAAYAWSFVIPSLVAVSIFFSCWQSVDDYPLPETVASALHTFIESVFTVELTLRFLSCPHRRLFCRSPLNAIDLLTCLPLGFRLVAAIAGVIDVNFDVEAILSALVVFPPLRLLKLSRRFAKIQLLFSAFLIAVEALPVLLYTMFAIALVFSVLVYAVEPRDNIANLPHAMWFVLVTMTTCGYGDVSPSSLPGKLITTVLMVVSILYMAMPIGIVGNAFSQAWDARDRLLLMHRIRKAFLQQGFNEAAFRDIVTVFLGDSDDELGFEEFQSVLQRMNININADRVHMLLNHLDQDGNGRINVDELLSGLFPSDYAAYFNTPKDSVVHSPSKLL